MRRFLIKIIFIIVISVFSVLSVIAEKHLLKDNWLYSLSNDEDAWKPIVMAKSFEEQNILMKKGDFIYYKTLIKHKDISDIIDNDEDAGIFIGKIEGVTNVFFNGKNAAYCPYNNKSIYFMIDKDDMRDTNILLIKIRKNLTNYSCKIAVIPYMDEYKNIRNNYLIINFLQVIIGVCMLFFGISYLFYYNRKLADHEFILFFLLCLFSFFYLITKLSFKYFFSEYFSFDFMILERIEYFSLYIQPALGLNFFLKIFNEKSILMKIFSYINIFITAIFIVISLFLDYDIMSDSLIYSQIFFGLNFILYIFLSVKNLLKKNYTSIFILSGLVIFIIMSFIEIENVLQMFSFADRFSFYILGFFIFDFTLGIYLSRQFINVNLNLTELSKSLEIKIADRTGKIEEMARQKTDFFANVSHELRTPLTLILGPLDAIISGKYGNKLCNDDGKFDMMLYNGTKLMKLINDTLDFTKIDSGKISVKPSNTDIIQLLKFFVSTAKINAEISGLDIVFNNNSQKVELVTYIDRDILEKVVLNLISNSLKFTPVGGQIIVQLDVMEDYFVISVKDNGIGIPEDKLGFIFERFSQVDSSLSRKYEGTGIGLSLTMELVKILGGSISVKSKPWIGSVFSITLPYDNKQSLNSENGFDNNDMIRQYLLPGKSLKEISGSKNSDRKTVDKKDVLLVVEDNHDMQKFLKFILEDDYELVFAQNGKDGLDKTEKYRPDLVLSDVMMPEMDGYKMTELIKTNEELKCIPVILLTAKADMFMKMEGFDKGADDYIIKPFDSNELCARVKVHMGVKKTRDKIIMRKLQLEKALEDKADLYRCLEYNEKRFRDMAMNLPVAIIEVDNEKRIKYYNRYAHELLGVSMNKVIMDYINETEIETMLKSVLSVYDHGNEEICFIGMKSPKGKRVNTMMKLGSIYNGMRMTILEFEPHVNIMQIPDDKFFDTYGITDREKEVIMLLIRGMRYKEIGEKLLISYKTVDNHISNIYMKTSVSCRKDLMNLIRHK